MSGPINVNNKCIAKNTIMLYLRMLFAMVVNLYTSRVVLNALGAEDFGIYGIVGGIVIMFTFLNSSLSGAIARFLTVELAEKEQNNFSKVFSCTLTLHILMAVIIIILSETIGLWFLNNKLILPADRLFAANIVYQFSILSCLISITQIPYNSTIIAHERMEVYAYVSILETLLKLVIVYLLLIGNFDKLILYSILIFVITMIISVTYRIYCMKKFYGCRYKFEINYKTMKPIITFSLWDLYGNLSVMVRSQGINIFQNLFFGPLINAANTLASQVQNAINGFADNFLLAVRPQMVKKHATKEFEYLQKLFFNATKFSFILLYSLSYPFFLECQFLLNKWLSNVPDYTVLFCQLSLISSLLSVLFILIQATGKIREMSVLNGTILILTLPISCFFLKNGYSPVTPFIINIILLTITGICDIIILKKIMRNISLKRFLIKVIAFCFLTCLISIPVPLFFHFYLDESWIRLLCISVCSSVIITSITFFLGLDKNMQRFTIQKGKEIILFKH